MADKILGRIESQSGVPGLVSVLADRVAPTDLQSLLLEVYRRISQRVRPAALLSGFRSNRFVRPAAVSPLLLLRWDQAAFSHLPPGVQPLALSPLCPLGTCSAVAPVDQNWAVTTARNTEVVSDSTNVLALEAALRRRALLRAGRPGEAVHLAASHRLVRAQRYDRPDLVAHFSVFALCSAGRDRGSLQFELAALLVHVRFYLSALRAFLGPTVPLDVALMDLGPAVRPGLLDAGLLEALRAGFEGVPCVVENHPAALGYYRGLRFHVYATTVAGRRVELVDGGCVDWTQKLLSDARERLVISGIGSDRLCAEFGEEIGP